MKRRRRIDTLDSIIGELAKTRAIRDPAHAKLAETRRTVVAGWMQVAGALESQGERTLAGEVRDFTTTLPPVLTDRERLAAQFIGFLKAQRSARSREDDLVRDRTLERTR